MNTKLKAILAMAALAIATSAMTVGCAPKVAPIAVPAATDNVHKGRIVADNLAHWLILNCVEGFLFVSNTRGGVVQITGADGKPIECK